MAKAVEEVNERQKTVLFKVALVFNNVLVPLELRNHIKLLLNLVEEAALTHLVNVDNFQSVTGSGVPVLGLSNNACASPTNDS